MGELVSEGDDRERDGESVTQSVKEKEETREGSLGLVVNGYNWVREAGAK